MHSFIHWRGRQRRIGEVPKVVLDVCYPILLIGIKINTDELIQAPNTPCVNHQTLLLGFGLIVLIAGNLLSFALLTVISGLLPPICIGGKMR